MLVTALPEIPKMETVTERLLHEERKMKEREDTGHEKSKAMTAKGCKKTFTCHYCGKPGHFKRNCRKRAADEKENPSENNTKRTKPHLEKLREH